VSDINLDGVEHDRRRAGSLDDDVGWWQIRHPANSVDVHHQPLDPLIVAGLWVLAGAPT